MKYLLIILSLLFSTTIFASQADIRFANIRYDMNTMYVDIEMKATNGSFVLGSQNLRVYYNTNALKLNTEYVKSSLTLERYSALKIVEQYENINADDVNQLKFDNNLGFVNISIELLDMIHGGERINSDWSAIAVLAFDIVDTKKPAELVWAREGRSNEYATAFVEVSEWVSPNSTKMKEVNEYTDFNTLINLTKDNGELNIQIGPNPTTDFVNVNSNSDQTTLSIVNMTGKVVKEAELVNGQNKIDMMTLSPGSYIFYINDGKTTISEKVIKSN